MSEHAVVTDDEEHPASRYRSADGAVFSSSKCPPGNAGLRCELPFGFCWTPMAPPVTSTQAASSTITGPLNNNNKSNGSNGIPPGAICITCLAYVNLYCQVDDSAGGHFWTSALCQSQNIMAAPLLLPQQQLQDNNGDNENVRDTRSTSSSSSSNWNKSAGDLLVSRSIEFRQPLLVAPLSSLAAEATAVVQQQPQLPQQQQRTVVLVIDQNLPGMDAQAIGTVLQHVLQQQQQQNATTTAITALGLIVFGKAVSIYQLGGIGGGVTAVADVVRTHEGFTEQQKQRGGERSYLGTSAEPLITCLAAQFGVSSSYSSNNNSENSTGLIRSGDAKDNDVLLKESKKKSRMEILKERKQARLQKQESSTSENNTGSDDINNNNIKHLFSQSRSPWSVARERKAASEPPYRCTGDAILCAIDLIAHGNNNNNNNTAISRSDRILLFTNGCPNLGDGSVVDTSMDKVRKGGRAAYSTVDVSGNLLARACEYYDVIAKAAAERGIGVDVFCTGSSELGLPAYQSLVEPSSGYVLSHDSFARTPHLRHNVGFVLQQTHMSLGHFFYEPDDDNDEDAVFTNPEASQQHHIAPSQDGTWIDGCTVDIRMSSFLSLTHLIGPGDLIESPDGPLVNEQAAFEQGVFFVEEQLKPQKNRVVPSIDMLESSLTRIRLGRYDPLSTFSVMLRLNDFFQHDEYAFFQCTVRYVEPEGQALVTRVTTHRLSVAKDVGEFLEAIDEEVVPVLLGKEAVYRSMFGRDVDVDHPFHAPHAGQLDSLAFDAQKDLDNTIFRISGSFRLLSLERGTRTMDLTEEGGIKAAGSSMDFAFPPELSDALRRLYHLRRGPFLSPGPLLSMDDRAEMRSLFVRLPLEDCLSMMAPALWSSGPLDEALARSGLSMEDVPPETLALWENRIIAADHSHSLFVWSGSATLAPKYDCIREQLKNFLLERSHKRFPMPNLHLLTETDSMSRRFTSLLGPSHGDPVEHQLAHFQALAQLSMEEQAKLHSRFRFYDPESDPSFRKWFWEVASAASASGQEGISLCD